MPVTRTSGTLPQAIDARNAVTRTALPTRPPTKTGLRPTRSDSRAQNGIVPIATMLAMIASHSMVVELIPMP